MAALPGGLAAERPCLLGVEESFSGKRWELRGGDERQGLLLSQRLDLPELVGRVLAARGIGAEEAESFLAPRLRESLPDPFVLSDMERAAERLAGAVMAGEEVAIFGDYDVDGATSSALLQRFLRAAGGKVRVYIPDRLTEGYGPNAPALMKLRSEGAGLAVTVDCGITAYAPLTAVAEAGLDVIVVDHHAAEAQLPPAYALVNPNRLDDRSGLGQLAAVGVAFLLAVATNRALRDAGWYARRSLEEPRLLAWLDLVALGTVCDVVPLVGLNRAFVAQGLKVMARRGNAGLAALADVARLEEAPGTYHAGFLLGPRVNAGGRVGEAGLGARLLATDSATEAQEIARRLDGFNSARREIEAAVLEEALAAAAGERRPRGLVLVAAHGWHPGVIGIVAARLKERFNLPAMVIAFDEKGCGKGSGRSVPGVDLGTAVVAARQAGLLINGGGHPMAAGLTVTEENLAPLKAFLSERLEREIARVGWRPALGIDGLLQPRGASAPLLQSLQQVAPFGTGNPEPRFALSNVRIAAAAPVGEGHLRCVVAGEDGSRLKGIAFRAAEGPLWAPLSGAGGRVFHLAGKLRADGWAGPDAVQFVIEDAAPA